MKKQEYKVRCGKSGVRHMGETTAGRASSADGGEHIVSESISRRALDSASNETTEPPSRS